MGKGVKRAKKNAGVGVDFRKVKHKVGKKLPKAQNETRTDFQSRSINLPSQSLAADKAGAAVSDRNLTLKELLAQLSHHNTQTRRDALAGLQQLLAAHPGEGRRHAAALLGALAPRLSDGEASVRAALLALLRGSALSALGPDGLAPFMPLLMAHLSAALTHLSADVRLDALGALGAVADAAPQLLADEQHLAAALGHYRGLLSRANRGRSVKSQALTGLLRVLASLKQLLGTALSAAAAPDGGAVGTAALPWDAAHTGVLLAHRSAPPPAATMRLPRPEQLLSCYTHSRTKAQQPRQPQQQEKQAAAAAAGASASAAGGASTGSKNAAAQLQAQGTELLVVLFDCWAEAAPASLAAAPEQESAQALVHILSCAQQLLTHLSPAAPAAAAIAAASAGGNVALSNSTSVLCPGFNTGRDKAQWLNNAAAVVLPKLLRVFPVTAPPISVSAQLAEQLQRFNLLVMQLLSGLMAAGAAWPAPAAGGQAAMQQDWHSQLLEFIAGVLACGSLLPGASYSATQQPSPAASSKSGGRQPAAAAGNDSQAAGAAGGTAGMLAALQCLQQVLPQLPPLPRRQLLGAVSQMVLPAAGEGDGAAPQKQQQPTATGSLRSACLQLQLQLLSQYLFDAVPDAAQEQDMAAWLAAAPKLLWQCGASRPQVSSLLLQQLYQAGRLSLPGSVLQQQVQELQPQLAALLATTLPAPGSKKKQQAQQQGQQQPVPVLVGPLAALPAACQALAFDGLAFQPQLGQPLLKAAALAVRLSSYSDAAVERLLDALLSSGCCSSSMAPDAFLGFAATLLSPPPAGGYVEHGSGRRLGGGWARHQLVVAVLCRWLHSYGPLHELLALLVPAALQQQEAALVQHQQAGGGGRQLALRCSSYSCISLAALAAGSWQPPGSSSSSSCAAPSPAGALPGGLQQALPGVLAAYCSSSVADVAAAAAAPAGTASADVPAAAVAAVRGCMQLVVPLVAALPLLLLPFAQQLCACCVEHGAIAAAASRQGGLAVAAAVLGLLMEQQGLKVMLVQQEAQHGVLLAQLEAAGAALERESGQAGGLAAVQRLQTALAVMCGR